MAKILIVENGLERRNTLAGCLQRQGFSVVMADDGKTGAAMVQTEKPDLILVDINMPERNGWEATCQIKAAASDESPPIIAFTEQITPTEAENAGDAGCANRVEKPIEFASLLVQIEGLLKYRPLPEPALLFQGITRPS